VEIRALRPTDDRRRFRSGDPDLDRFFQAYAGQNQFRHHIGTTYVAVEGREVLGYVTVAAGSLEIDDLPPAVRRELPCYPLPILRLARLAVDAAFQGGGVGRELLRFALGLAVRMRTDYGCIGVVVDARPNAVPFYRRFGFVALDVTEGLADSRPAPVAMFLSAREIGLAEKARTPRGKRVDLG
jgi:GNAT superfamily N-acetyltransferase